MCSVRYIIWGVTLSVLKRRGLAGILAVCAVGLLTLAISSAGGSARAAVNSSAHTRDACVSKSVRHGRFGGVLHAQEVAGCEGESSGSAAIGTPPLIWHNGPMMGTPSTGPVVVTPIFWNPADHPMTNSYKSIITRYLSDVATASGTTSNVYSTLNEYYGSKETSATSCGSAR